MNESDVGLNLTVQPFTEENDGTCCAPSDCIQTSVMSLFNELINHQLREEPRAYLIQPNHPRHVVRRRLRKVMFNTLFENTSGRFRNLEAQKRDGVNGEQEVSVHIYSLRLKRQFDKANKLERLLQKLKNMSSDPQVLNNQLKFLVSLIDSCPEPSPPPIGHGDLHIPVIASDKGGPEVFPDGPAVYGDTLLYQKHFNNTYTQYPSHIFCGKGVSVADDCLSKEEFINPKIFSLTPGLNLHGDGLFNVKGFLKDEHERKTRQTVFGALGQRSSGDVNMELQLPDLPDPVDSRYSSMFELPQMESVSASSTDEGIGSACSTPLKDSALCGQTSDTDNIWELALQLVPSRHYTWERRGRPPARSENPYLTEAGPMAVDVILRKTTQALNMIDRSLDIAPPRPVTRKTLVKDLFNLMLALPSETFQFCERKHCFYLTPGTYISGLTHQGLTNLCQDVLNCGTNHWRLAQFATPPVVDSLYSAGLIFQAFTNGVRRYLHHFCAAVLSVTQDRTIMEVNCIFNRVMQQMRFLAVLCMCDGKDNTSSSVFPTGLKLLTYIYQETQFSCNSVNYPLMLSLLKATCVPYVMFIQDWLFSGVCRDIYSEFMIKVNPDYLQFRDKHYWTMGYVLTTQNSSESVPVFLQAMAHDIFVCGKSINLLKLCCPNHFMCSLDRDIPRIAVTFSEQELQSISDSSATYTTRMQQIARHKLVSRAERLRLEERARQDLLLKARQAAVAEIDRLQARIVELKMTRDKKKRKHFNELKVQMERDLLRRAILEEDEKEADAALVDELTRREALETEADIELERQAREELVSYYAELSEEAAAREQRALWRVRRRQLDAKRIALLAEEEERWRQALEGLKEGLKEQESESSVQPNNTATSRGHELPPSGRERNLLDITLPGESASQEVTPDQFLQDMLDAQTKRQTVQTTVSGPSELDQAMSDINSIPTGNLLDLSHFAPQVASDDRDGHAFSLPSTAVSTTNVLDVSIADLPSWTQRAFVDVPAGGGNNEVATSVSQRANLTDFGNLPTWVRTDDVVHVSPPTGLQESDVTDGREETDSGGGDNGNVDVTPSSGKSDGTVNVSETEVCKDGEYANTAEEFVNKEQKSTVSEEELVASSQASVKSLTASEHVAHGKHVSQETETFNENTHVKFVPGQSVSYESGACISQESEEKTEKLCVRIVDGAHSSAESQPAEELVKNANIHGHVSKETEQLVTIKNRNVYGHVSQETVVGERVEKKANFFGHVSQMSRGEYEILAPKLKRVQSRYANKESEIDRTYEVVRRRPRQVTTAVQESKADSLKPVQKMAGHMYASKESDFVDIDGNRLERFKVRNVHGHSSDSTVQRLLYGETIQVDEGWTQDEVKQDTDSSAGDLEEWGWMEDKSLPYEIKFDRVYHHPSSDLTTSIIHDPSGGLLEYGIGDDGEVDAHNYMSVDCLLRRSLAAPIMAQVSLVNQCLLTYFLHDLKIEDHFVAIRRFLLMQDGEFAQVLSDQLFERLAMNPHPQKMLNPAFLNRVLTNAIQSSVGPVNSAASRLSFALKSMPDVFMPNAINSLDCLELQYKVDWPINIVITESCMSKYSKVFSFMLQLRRTTWVLKDVVNSLKRTALLHNAARSTQFRQLQLHRHEMQHLVNIIQGYLANQIIDVTWQEFQDHMTHQVHSLDELHHKHADYLNRAIFRCLLNKKAAPVMKVITDIFCLILKFRSQLLSASWQPHPRTGEAVHPAFSQLIVTCMTFKEYLAFLLKVINILSMRGYQPHLQELLLRLDFNNFYSAASTGS